MTQARNLSRLLNKDITTYMYTATAGQTVFTGSDTNSQTLTIDNQSIMVTYNGVMLEKGSEFTVAVNTVTLLAGAEVNAEVNVIVFNNASLGGYVKSTGGDIDGGVNITSGNLLVGKTVDTLATSGTVLFANGQVDASVDGNYVAKFNRKSSDGTIIELRKDTTGIVGSIGVVDGDNLFIGSSASDHAGFYFNNTNVKPYVNGAVSDNTMNIGASAERFKDIFISGGIHLGGTGAANKLDDYEEGTFTAGVSQGTIGGGDGVYVKVGNLVFCGITIGNFSNTSSGNAIVFTGLPFVSHSVNQGSNGSVFCRYISGGFPDATQVNTSATTGRMWKSGSTGWASVNHNDITSGTNAYFFISLTYRAA